MAASFYVFCIGFLVFLIDGFSDSRFAALRLARRR